MEAEFPRPGANGPLRDICSATLKNGLFLGTRKSAIAAVPRCGKLLLPLELLV
jgi:hypothetical protein